MVGQGKLRFSRRPIDLNSEITAAPASVIATLSPHTLPKSAAASAICFHRLQITYS